MKINVKLFMLVLFVVYNLWATENGIPDKKYTISKEALNTVSNFANAYKMLQCSFFCWQFKVFLTVNHIFPEANVWKCSQSRQTVQTLAFRCNGWCSPGICPWTPPIYLNGFDYNVFVVKMTAWTFLTSWSLLMISSHEDVPLFTVRMLLHSHLMQYNKTTFCFYFYADETVLHADKIHISSNSYYRTAFLSDLKP